jgi:hypothetical protein
MKIRFITRLSVFLVLIGLLAACTPASAPASQASAVESSAIEIEKAWSRSTPEMMDGSGIVYMVIKNNGDEPDQLVASKSPVAAFAELHETSLDENGVMRMRGVKGGFIEVPAHGTAALSPAGLHVMLVDLKSPLKTGDSFPLTLKFEKAGEMTINVPVLDHLP